MTTIIEKVTQAIKFELKRAAADGGWYVDDVDSPEGDGKVGFDGGVCVREMAIAALTAMRDATPSMIEAGESGYEEYHKPSGTYLSAQPASVWALMIDAALEEKV